MEPRNALGRTLRQEYEKYVKKAPIQAQWNAPIKFRLLEAAKSRGKTLGEYLNGDATRLEQIHYELAFDMVESMLQATSQEIWMQEGNKGATDYASDRLRRKRASEAS